MPGRVQTMATLLLPAMPLPPLPPQSRRYPRFGFQAQRCGRTVMSHVGGGTSRGTPASTAVTAAAAAPPPPGALRHAVVNRHAPRPHAGSVVQLPAPAPAAHAIALAPRVPCAGAVVVVAVVAVVAMEQALGASGAVVDLVARRGWGQCQPPENPVTHIMRRLPPLCRRW